MNIGSFNNLYKLCYLSQMSGVSQGSLLRKTPTSYSSYRYKTISKNRPCVWSIGTLYGFTLSPVKSESLCTIYLGRTKE